MGQSSNQFNASASFLLLLLLNLSLNCFIFDFGFIWLFDAESELGSSEGGLGSISAKLPLRVLFSPPPTSTSLATERAVSVVITLSVPKYSVFNEMPSSSWLSVLGLLPVPIFVSCCRGTGGWVRDGTGLVELLAKAWRLRVQVRSPTRSYSVSFAQSRFIV